MERYSFDREYVESLRANDPRVQNHFASYFRQLLLIKLRRRVPTRETAEDLVQETFLRVLTTLRSDGLRSASSLGAFVDGVCNRVLLEYYRAGSRTVGLAEDATGPSDERSNPEEAFVTGQSQKQVETILSGLRPKDRDLLRKLFLEEEDKDQICREFGVDREYLRVLLHRARNRFRSLMEGTKAPAAEGARTT